MQRFIFTFFVVAMAHCLVTKAQTGLNLPYSQSFSADSIYKTGWKTLNYGNRQDYWYISPTKTAGGTSGEMVHTTKYAYAAKTLLVSPALNTSGARELLVSFNYYLKEQIQGSQAELLVQSSVDGEVWTNEQWRISTGFKDNTTGPCNVNMVVKNNTNSTHTYIAFVIQGDLSSVQNWSIDDINITASALCLSPTVKAKDLSFTGISNASATAQWIRGNGTGVMVVARKSVPVENSPSPTVTYTASNVMGLGSNIGNNTFVVYKGTGTSVTVTNLEAYNDYYFAVFEYNSETCYNFEPLSAKVFTANLNTKIWKGDVSEEWSNAANWTGQSEPMATQQVVIPSGCINYPVLDKKTTIKSLCISEGAKIRLEKTPDLTVTDSISNSGTIEMMNGVITAGAVYSYPKSVVYLYAGYVNIAKWAGGPARDFGYGALYLYGGSLHVSGDMKFGYATDNLTGLFMQSSLSELNAGGSLVFNLNSTQPSGGIINLLGTNGAGPFEFYQQNAGIMGPKAYHLTVNAPSKTYRFNAGIASTIDIYGNLTIVAGTVELTNGSYATKLNVKGSVTIGSDGYLNCGGSTTFGMIAVSGDWDNYSAGNFTPGNNTVEFNGKAQKIKGSTTFYGLKLDPTSASVITFESGTAKRVTVNGPLTINGAATGKLALRSDVAGTQWEIDPKGTRSVTNADIRDAKNVNTAAIDATAATNINTGNNTSWNFSSSPTIYTSTSTITSFGNVVANSISAEVTYDISTANLTANLVITAPTGFRISKTPWEGFTSSITLTPVSGGIPYQTIYVRMNPTAAGALSSNITHTSTGATTKNVAVSGTGTAAAPFITATSTVSYLGNLPINSVSQDYSYFVHACNLTADLTVTVTGNFEISKTSGSGYAKTITFQQTGGIASGIVYYRYTPKGSFSSGTISNSSTGATTVNRTIMGNGNYNGTMSINKSSLANFGNIELNQNSAVDSFTVSGTGLYQYLTVRPSNNFVVSTNKKYTFVKTLLLNTKNGSLSDTVVYVKFVPTAKGPLQGSIEIASSNALYNYVAVSGTGVCSATPSLTVSSTSINFPNTFVGDCTEPKPFVLGGCSLKGNAGIKAENGFEISVYPDKGYTDSLNIAHSGGVIKDTTIYVRIKPEINQYISGGVTITSKDATDKAVYFNCQGYYAGAPLLTFSADTVSPFTVTSTGNVSAVKSYKLAAHYLTSDKVTLVAPDGFLISNQQTPISVFNDTMVLSTSDNTITDTTVYVLFSPSVKKTYDANIKHTTNDLTDKWVNVSGICANSALTLSASGLPAFANTKTGESSAVNSFTVSGAELFSDVVITAPAGFEISKTATGGFASSVSLAMNAGTLDNTAVYVRFKPTEVKTYTADVQITSLGLNSTVSVSGQGISGNVGVTTVNRQEVFLYPNPATDKIYINHTTTMNNLSIEVTDLQGQVCITRKITAGTLPEIDVTTLPSGLYLVKVINGETIWKGKVVKK